LADAGASVTAGSGSVVPHGVELRHLRYFVAVADAGTFTNAAERMYIAQPTLSQQIRRLEEMVGTPLLQRRPEGVRLTAAGAVLLEESRTVLSLIDHGVSRTRQAAGVGRQRLRFVVPPYLPETLTVEIASRLRSSAAGAGVDIAWMETPLDEEFSSIRQRRADAGLGWMDPAAAGTCAAFEMMTLAEFEPVAWIPADHPAASRGTIRLGELVQMDIVHGPRRVSAGTYDAWLAVLRAEEPRVEFIDPPFRQSLAMTLACAATGRRPTTVLTGPCSRTGAGSGRIGPGWATSPQDMVPVRIDRQPLAATATLVWNGDLPRQLQQVLVDTAMAAFCDQQAS
jgi:DNA-binding transcriptional LysR family regulator